MEMGMAELMALKKEITELTHTSEAGAGLVKVTMNGDFDLLNISYEKNPFVDGDIETFIDLVRMAHNDCVEQIKEKSILLHEKHFGSVEDLLKDMV